MTLPYIHTTSRVLVQEPSGFDNQQGVIYQEAGGEHAVWAGRVPFLPALLSDDLIRLGRSRIALIQQRQSRFIYDLARARDNRATFELRFIAHPNPTPGEPNLIDIIFLGKVFAPRRGAAALLAEQLWRKFAGHYPLEDPFNYPLEPITDKAEFERYYEPLPFAHLGPQSLTELRKYEDMPIPNAAVLGRVARKGDYIAHPFVPTQDFNPMGRFLVALASQPEPCFVGVSVRPTRMFDQEVHNVSFAIGQFKKTATEDDDVTEEYIRSRANIGVYVYTQLMEEREQLVMVRVYVVGQNGAPSDLVEALGSEMMGNVKNVYPTQWSAVQPRTEAEWAIALYNLRYLEHDFWGDTQASLPLERLRYLASPQEAVGAFRLPVPPESGYVPGVLVKDEPFVAPADDLELWRQARANFNDAQQQLNDNVQAKKITLGQVYHRGNATAQQFRVNVRDLTRHMLIAGSTGSGKSTTIKHMLTQLWQEHRLPFLVLYPLDKPDYRELRGMPGLRDDLLVFTLGDDNTSPFRFNPFEVPTGLLLKTHISRLMRVFSAAFTLADPLPMIYRDALRRVYRDKGWNLVHSVGQADGEYPVMSEFYEAIRQITEQLEYGREVKDNVRQASVIRIADLLENAGYVVNVRRSMSFSHILSRPVVMEIGRAGSIQDIALLMGFLLMRFAEEFERHPRPQDAPHITVVEEAHRLMADTGGTPTMGDSRGSAGEDFSNVLAEVRGYGEGLVIAEQIPTLLVKGAIGNTYLKVMHWLEDAPSFDLFGNVMNLSAQQREYARSLTPGYAIVRSPYGRPVHIKIPEFGDQPGFDPIAAKAISDAEIAAAIQPQRERIHLEDVPIIPWEATLSVGSVGRSQPAAEQAPAHVQAPRPTPGWSDSAPDLKRVLSAPMQTCAFCQPLHLTNQCQHRQAVLHRLLENPQFTADNAPFAERILREKTTDRWALVRQVGQQIANHANNKSPEDQRGMVYCYFAHRAEAVLQASRELEAASGAKERQNARDLLVEFDNRYRGE